MLDNAARAMVELGVVFGAPNGRGRLSSCREKGKLISMLHFRKAPVESKLEAHSTMAEVG